MGTGVCIYGRIVLGGATTMNNKKTSHPAFDGLDTARGIAIATGLALLYWPILIWIGIKIWGMLRS